MATGFLVDSNIFLEVILQQRNEALCESFLNKNRTQLSMTDFALHSIGVTLFREDRHKSFLIFLRDILPRVAVVSLPDHNLAETHRISLSENLDFDDSYQLATAEHFNLELVTLDNDFRDVKSTTKITLLH
jgi:predicted nucleic acid-binding protein